MDLAMKIDVSRTSNPPLPCRRLPTENRPRIMLHGDHSIDVTNARIERVARAPILHYAIGM
jgi:hypothetical protein